MSIGSQPVPCRDTALHSHLSQRLHPSDQRLAENPPARTSTQPLHPVVTAARRPDGTYPRRGTGSRATITASAMAPQRGGGEAPVPPTQGGFEGCTPAAPQSAACLAGVLSLSPYLLQPSPNPPHFHVCIVSHILIIHEKSSQSIPSMIPF